MQEESEHYIDLFCKMLHGDKLKCTEIRQNILRVFFKYKYITVEKILRKLQDDFDTPSTKQSVYANLKLLLSYNIISKKNQRDSFYELSRHSCHFHLLCSGCGKFIVIKNKILSKKSC